jgi:hypothetical protein
MIKYLPILLLVSTSAFANCKQTSASIEREGIVANETLTVCKEGVGEFPKIKKGDVILESEVNKSRVDVGYFMHRNTRCRLFMENQTFNGKLRVYNGVICQVDNSDTNWLVVDKW